jgi:alpha/beta superfamily hydrolase
LRRSRLIARKKSPLPIETLLEKILRYIKEIDPNAQVLLVGSWANGSWVSSERLENVASFAGLLDANSQFEAAYRTAFGEFLLLREKVTGKSSKDFSDIDLLIDSQLEFNADMINIPSAYKVNFIKGKADAQKGLVIEGK